jgi:hypothetical protein
LKSFDCSNLLVAPSVCDSLSKYALSSGDEMLHLNTLARHTRSAPDTMCARPLYDAATSPLRMSATTLSVGR